MPLSSRHGMALLEVILALVILGSALIAIGPVVGRTVALLTRGRALLEGSSLAVQRLESLRWGVPRLCGTMGGGSVVGRFATVRWTITAKSTVTGFEAEIRDRAGRFPAETLTAVVGCTP